MQELFYKAMRMTDSGAAKRVSGAEPEWWSQLKSNYLEVGYAVIGTTSSYRIGQVVDSAMIGTGELVRFPQPFRIVSETTVEDFLARRRSRKFGWSREAVQGMRFYRMVTE